MKVLSVIVFACVAACALASYGYEPGFKRVYGGISARYNNAARQEAVNDKAHYVGSGTGTEKYDGVPGTGLDFGYGYGRYNDYNRGYGYGHDNYAYGNDNYGYGYGHGYGH